MKCCRFDHSKIYVYRRTHRFFRFMSTFFSVVCPAFAIPPPSQRESSGAPRGPRWTSSTGRCNQGHPGGPGPPPRSSGNPRSHHRGRVPKLPWLSNGHSPPSNPPPQNASGGTLCGGPSSSGGAGISYSPPPDPAAFFRENSSTFGYPTPLGKKGQEIPASGAWLSGKSKESIASFVFALVFGRNNPKNSGPANKLQQ